MKKQVKDQLEKMVKAFNAKNEKNGMKSRYGVESNSFKRGRYSVEITFNRAFFSTDLEVLLKVIADNELNFFLGHHSDETKIYLQ